MPSIIDLGQKVKLKYPGMYDDLSDQDVGVRVKTKYPTEYADFSDVSDQTVVQQPQRLSFLQQVQRPLGVIAGAEKGFVQEALGTGFGAGKFAESALRGTVGRGVEAFTGRPQPQRIFGQRPEAITPKTTPEKVGAFAEQIAEFVAPSTKIAKLEKGLPLLYRMALEASFLGGQTALHEGEINKNVKDSIILGGAFPLAGATLKTAKQIVGPRLVTARQNLGGRVINSLVKPLLKDFSYGKNPGRGVAQEGIVASSLDDLAGKISQRRAKVGQALDELLEKVPTQPRLNLLDDTLKPLDDAMNVAARNNNSALLNRLAETKRAITENLVRQSTPEGERIISQGQRNLSDLTLQEARKINTEIGDLTKWTGNLSDDNTANKALKQVYGNIKGKMESTVARVDKRLAERFIKLKERYGDLTSAEIATKYRDKLVQRQDLISLKGHVGGATALLVTAIATGGINIPVVLAGATGASLDKILGSPVVKTRFARWLALAGKEEKQRLFQGIPALQGTIQRVFGGELKTLQNQPLGLTLTEITPKTIRKEILTSASPKGIAGGFTVKNLTTKEGFLLPKAAQGRIQDIAGKLEAAFPDKQLGKQFTSQINVNKTTFKELKQKALQLINNQQRFLKGKSGLFEGSRRINKISLREGDDLLEVVDEIRPKLDIPTGGKIDLDAQIFFDDIRERLLKKETVTRNEASTAREIAQRFGYKKVSKIPIKEIK